MVVGIGGRKTAEDRVFSWSCCRGKLQRVAKREKLGGNGAPSEIIVSAYRVACTC